MQPQIILMYHDIYKHDTSESGFQNATALKYKVRSDEFEKQVKSVSGYLSRKNLPKSSVIFTFDDGGESFFTLAAPILEKYDFKGTFFITTGFIGSKGFLNADQIKDLESRGHIIGTHSHSHPERMNSMSEEEIADEWHYSNMILSEILHNPIETASIPNGYASKDVVRCMIKSGIKKIYTSNPTTKTFKYNKAEVIGRYVITENDTDSKIISIISSARTRYAKYLRFKILGWAKTLLGNAYLEIRKSFSN